MDSAVQTFLALSDQIERVREDFPYSFNLLDAVHETGHSRILCDLLNLHRHGHYPILESFLALCRAHNPNFPMQIDRPQIAPEVANIDILIEDTTYAIINENKANDAIDQPAQLGRYIQFVRNRRTLNKGGYTDAQIFVIYLPSGDWKDPSDESWLGEKEKFAPRYLKLSYEKDLLDWMKLGLLPAIPPTEEQLQMSLKIYIDHWEGRTKTCQKEKP